MGDGAGDFPARRFLSPAEKRTPDLLCEFIADLECTETSLQVWQRLVQLGRDMGVPFIDFISASSHRNWRRTLFIRTSYDSRWLSEVNRDPELQKWSYFRLHALSRMTPLAVGLEYADDHVALPQARVKVLEMAARNGMRAGFAIPLRLHAPPQSALITFTGNHSRREFDAIIKAHGWTMHGAALMAHQRYMTHFVAEFSDRNRLSTKQRELLEQIGMGHRDKRIAKELGVSVSAVRQRMETLQKRTGMQNRPELAALAMSMGILPDPLRHAESEEPEIIVEMDGVPCSEPEAGPA